MNIRIHQLEKLKDSKTLVILFRDEFDDSSIGFIVDISEDFILLEEVDDNGKLDGIVILRIEDITRVRWEGNELNSLSKLIDLKERIKGLNAIDISNKYYALDSVFQKFKHIGIHIEEIDNGVLFIGEIAEIDADTIILHEFGTKSNLDRSFIMLELEDITKIQAGGIYEMGLMKIFGKI